MWSQFILASSQNKSHKNNIWPLQHFGLLNNVLAHKRPEFLFTLRLKLVIIREDLLRIQGEKEFMIQFPERLPGTGMKLI